jgi:hypothetical protein
MPEPDPPGFDDLMGMWRGGDREAFKAQISPLYEDLRRIARQQMRRAVPARTLQTTALVHEAYLRLERDFRGQFQNKAHLGIKQLTNDGISKRLTLLADDGSRLYFTEGDDFFWKIMQVSDVGGEATPEMSALRQFSRRQVAD